METTPAPHSSHPQTDPVELTPDEAARAARTAAALCSPEHRVDDPQWVAAARAAWSELPLSVRQKVHEFRRRPGAAGTLLIRNLPLGDAPIPSTPAVNGSVQRETTVAAAVLMMLACGLGDPAAFRAEKSGALVQDVVPVPGQEDFQGNAGSVALMMHNENAFHEHRPDFVMLLCLRADHEQIAGLRTSCIREALPLLTAETREALSLPEFSTQPPPSFGTGGAATPPHAVLFGDPDDPDIRVDFAATSGLGPRAEKALTELEAALDRVSRTVRLVPGELAVVDNRTTLHGRTAFRPRYDGQDRWLQRAFVLNDLRRSRDHRPDDGYVLVR
ncbi:TauD/TfdA family dioxygenase [Kitasatospora sp. KL5]|uniref:TauD/TfdA family dioxygenase n=1 Tax=Kitasatospora sp. KL5 TaxID=3425125 RepID=UPI003D6E0C2D